MAVVVPELRKISTQAEMEEVIEAAKVDDHDMRFATHAVRMNGEVVGAICLAPLPFVWGWSKKGVVEMRESLNIRQMVASLMNDRGVNAFLVACDNDSPYLDYMEGFGYESLDWNTNLFIDKV